jgi:hypothetical protein
MGQLLEVEIPVKLGGEWPKYLEGQTFSVEVGRTSREDCQDGSNIDEPMEAVCKWFLTVDCRRGPVIVRATGGLDREEGKYVIEVRTRQYTWRTRKQARLMEEEIVGLLCKNGGKLYDPVADL